MISIVEHSRRRFLVFTIPLLFLFFHGAKPSLGAEGDNTVRQPPADTQARNGPNPAPPLSLNKEYFAGYWTDTRDILASPAKWDRSDWITASAVLGISAGLFTQDDKIKSWVQDHKSAASQRITDDVSTLYLLSFPAMAGLGLYGWLAQDETASRTFLLGAESAIVTAAFVGTLKTAAGRYRPYTGASHDTWSGPAVLNQGSRLSFPSGDASTAFAFASVVASEYDNRVVPPLVYTAAALVGLERIHKNAHWSSDVFLGSAIGYFTGKSIVRYHGGKAGRLTLVPVIDDGTTGMMVSVRF